MLRKIYKNDFFMIWKTELPLLISMIVCGLVGGAIYAISAWIPWNNENLVYSLSLQSGLTVLGVLLTFAVVALAALSCIFVYDRFYRSVFTDEGYLTMTIPAETHQLLGGKLLSGLTHMLIVAAAFAVSMILLFVPSGVVEAILSDSGSVSPSDLLGIFLPDTFEEWLRLVFTLIEYLTAALAEFIMVYAAIVFGSLLIRKHKIIGLLLFIFILTMLRSFISTLLSLSFLLMVNTSYIWGDILSKVFMILFDVGFGIGLYALMYRQMHKHFNIE